MRGSNEPEDHRPLDGRAAEILDHELADRGCEALVVTASSARDPDLAPFVGPVHLGRAFLFLPRPSGSPGGPPLLGYLTPMERDEAAATGLSLLIPEALEVERLAREVPEPGAFWSALLARALELAAIPPGRLALAGHLGAGHAAAFTRALGERGYSLIDGHEIVRRLRQRKGAPDLASIRRAAAGTVAAFRRVAEILAAAEPFAEPITTPGSRRAGEGLGVAGGPLTVGRLRGEIFAVLAAHGLEQPEGNIVAPAEEGAAPHSIGTNERVLRRGESLVVDLFPRERLFADCTRTFCVGEPPAELAAAHALVHEALEAARGAVRQGVRGWDLQEAVCRLFQEHGFKTPVSDPGTLEGYVHGLGHGIGYELHEAPSFRKEAGVEGVLGAGDVITLEPGLYDPAAGWAVRLEDLVVVGEEGIAEDLTPLPYALDPREW